MAKANCFDPRWSPTNVGPHLWKRQFDTMASFLQKYWIYHMIVSKCGHCLGVNDIFKACTKELTVTFVIINQICYRTLSGYNYLLVFWGPLHPRISLMWKIEKTRNTHTGFLLWSTFRLILRGLAHTYQMLYNKHRSLRRIRQKQWP